MYSKLKTASFKYALGDSNLEEIVILGGTEAGTTAVVMRAVIERIQENMQTRPKPRWGFVQDTDGYWFIYTPRWEFKKLSGLHYRITDRSTGEIVKER
jgi:hypothetical protein